MKTPRDFLLERHRAAETKLDAVREKVLAAELSPAPPAEKKKARGPALACWQELILPYRRVWAGLAAAWVVILAVNISSAATQPMTSANAASQGPALAAALQEQRQLLSQLLDPFTTSPAVRKRTPGPRGDLRNASRAA